MFRNRFSVCIFVYNLWIYFHHAWIWIILCGIFPIYIHQELYWKAERDYKWHMSWYFNFKCNYLEHGCPRYLILFIVTNFPNKIIHMISLCTLLKNEGSDLEHTSKFMKYILKWHLIVVPLVFSKLVNWGGHFLPSS